MTSRTRRALPLLFATTSLIAACGLRDEVAVQRQGVIHAKVDNGTPLAIPPDTIVPPDVTSSTSKQVVGSLPGASDVTADGEARYSIPLWVPPGRAGMQPGLSLEYRSRGGNGLVGVGWSLAGLSQITRCPHSVAVDGYAKPVYFSAGDDFCLDGQPLKYAGDATQNGVVRKQYRTERDSFALIVAQWDPKNGPTHFTVYEKSGLIRDYDGFHIVHNATVTWMLTLVQDRYGNTMRISYNDAGGYLYPKQIDYAGSLTNSALVANRSVKFSYEARGDVEYSAAVGSVEINQRLSRIEMWGPDVKFAGSLLRAYSLTYQSSVANGRSLLSAVSALDASGNHLGDSNFEYEPGTAGFDAIDAGVSDAISGYGGFKLIDMNGDGVSDLLYMTKDANGQPELAARAWDPINQRYGDRYEFHLGGVPDFSNTFHSATPILGNPSVPNTIVVWETIQDGTGHTQPVVQEIANIGSGIYPGGFVGQPPINEMPFAADFDGDGLADIIAATAVAGPPYQQAFEFRRNLGTHPASFAPGVPIFVPSNWPVGLNNSFGLTMPYRAVDFFGDGRQQIPMCPQGGTQPGMALLVGNDGATPSNIVACSFAVTHTPMFFDVNGDGLEDVFYPDAGDGTFAMRTVLNPGPSGDNGATPPTKTISGTRLAGAVRSIDYDLDGHPDVIATINNSSSVVSVLKSSTSAAGFTMAPTSYQGPNLTGNADPNALEVGDVNGDGLQDYVIYDSRKNSFTVYQRKGNQPDMLTRAVDGIGTEATFWYKPISDPVTYSSQPISSVGYPLRMIKGGVWVVRRHSVSNGTAKGALNNYYHTYEDGLEDLRGRGFLGFNAHEVTLFADNWSRNRREVFDNGARPSSSSFYPYVGLPTHEIETVTLNGGVLLSRANVDRTYATVEDSDFHFYFPYAQTTETNVQRDDHGTLTPTYHEKVTIQGIDKVGNVTSASTDEGSGEVHTTSVTYQNDVAHWLINEPTLFTEVAHAPSGEGTTRNRAFKYNPQGNVEWEVVEPNIDASGNISALPQPQPDGVVTLFIHYARDLDGQLNAVTRDLDFTPTAKQRSVSLFYDDADRTYATRVSNKLGHMVHVAYHPGLGIVAASQDEQGIYSRWKWDTFGRLKRAEPGTSEAHSLVYNGYVGFGANDPQNHPKLSLEVDRTGDAKDASVTQYDPLGRPSLAKTNHRNDGRWTVVRRSWDFDGNLATVSRPHFDGAAEPLDKFTYDGVGRLIRQTFADGRVLQTNYFGTHADAYDADPGDKTAIRRTVTRDLGGNIVSSVEHAAANAGRPARDLTIAYKYAPFDLLESMVGLNGVTTSTAYDRLGRMLTTIDPTEGRKDSGYNAFGEVETLTVNKYGSTPEVRTLAYDDIGRPRVMTSRDGTTTWTWDSGLNGVGQLGSVDSPDGVNVSLDYGVRGDVAESRWTIAGETFTVDRVSDSYGRLQKVTYPTVNGGRFAVRYDYGAHGSLRYVRNDAQPTQVYWTELDNDAYGNPTNPSGAFPQYQLGSKITVHNIEDTTRPGFLAGIQASTPSLIQSLSYSFDSKGNLFTRKDNLHALQESFDYDELNRVQHWTVDAVGGQHSVVRFDYDDLGNRTGRTYEAGGGTSHTYQYAQVNGGGPYALTGVDNASAASYDGEGNQATGPSRIVAFSAFGLPTFVNNPIFYQPRYSFLYDGLGNRVSKTTIVHRLIGGDRTVTTLSLGGLYRRTTDSTNSTAPTHDYTIQAPGGPIAEIETTTGGTEGAPLYVLRDHLGSADTIVDDSGTVKEVRKFDPFGVQFEPAAPAGPAPAMVTSIPFGFTGHEHDRELGLINMKGRMYDPQLGRFLSPDPVGDSPLLAGGLNSYSYVGNNPGNATDPTGLTTVVIVGTIGEDPGGGVFGGLPGPLPGGPTGATLPPVPQPTPRHLPAPTGGAGTGPWNAAESDAKRIAASNAQAHFTAADRFGEMLRVDPHFEGFRAWAEEYDARTSIYGRIDAAMSTGMALLVGELGRESDNILGFVGRGVHFVDPDGAIGFALAMDAQETHIAQAQIAGALLRETEGVLLDAAARVGPTGEAYTVAYQTKLGESELGASRSVHFNRANAALDADIQSNPQFATAMENTIPGVSDAVSKVGGRQTPAGWIWHHAKEEGIMQLVEEVQHTAGSIFWRVMHPGGKGGYSIWAIPRGAPKN